MKMNNTTRFLFESALYLGLDPRRALRSLCAGVDDASTATDSATDGATDGNWTLARFRTQPDSLHNCCV